MDYFLSHQYWFQLHLCYLPEEVKKMVEKKDISMSHARVLSKLDDDDKAVDLAKKIVTLF